MSNFASRDLIADQLNALVKKLGGHTSVLAILSGQTKFQIVSVGALEQETAQIITLAGKSTSSLVEAGNYGWKNDNVNDKKFPFDPSLDGE
jgi:hypothetical protein